MGLEKKSAPLTFFILKNLVVSKIICNFAPSKLKII
jgi:hypothetical protein